MHTQQEFGPPPKSDARCLLQTAVTPTGSHSEMARFQPNFQGQPQASFLFYWVTLKATDQNHGIRLQDRLAGECLNFSIKFCATVACLSLGVFVGPMIHRTGAGASADKYELVMACGA